MIIQHKAKRLDNGKNIQGFVMKMWGQYHIIDPEDENTAYPVLEESIDPVREFVPGRWFVNEKQIPMLQDVVLICKGWYSPCYKDEYEALRAYQAKLCMVEEKDLGYGDILQYSLLPACEAFLSRRRFCALFYDKMFCEDIFVHNNTSRGYRIIFENGCYGVITNESLNQEVFFSEVDAIKAAEEYANSCDMLRADQMHLQVLESYEYIRGCDGYVLRSYLADMGNGYLYVKDFMTYAHVVKDTPKAREAYRKGIIENQKYNKVSKSAFHPKGVNMYRCKNDGEWLYAEARYTH